ncbi:MFS transporter [Streptococcus caviae]|uniref:MFS transporter n=1 Tax=Streptococcus sp. 'caviae' TaxID=1915004 RepID=UPI00094B8608|nr:MFS transporter [Streptococcus sp. 'caviae']OLN84694.1 MFS transporter [Streptococcus sp. 'caviae']
MAEEFNNGNTPENPAGGAPEPENQADQPQAQNPAEQPVSEQPVPEQSAGEPAAYQEAQSQPQAPVNTPEPAVPQQTDVQQGQMNFEQPTVPPTVNPAFQSAPARKELIVLPIISFVVSVITLILAWLAPLPIIYVIIAFLALIYAVVSLIVNLKRKKVLSIIALVLAAVVFLASGAAVFVRQSGDEQVKTEKHEKKDDKEDTDDEEDEGEEDSTDVQDYIADSSDYEYKWTESKFEDLEFAGYSNNDGSKVKSVLKKFGKASDATINGDALTLRYKGNTDDERVRLSFRKQYDGTFILSSGSLYFNSSKVKTSERGSYKSNWTKADVDALTVGDRETGSGGAKLDDIIKKHGNPVEAREVIESYGRGIEKSLRILYSDYSSSDDSKLSYVSLEFVEQSNGDYLLTYKYPK